MTLTINDMCSCFGVARTTVERWVRQGKIPAFSSHGSFRFKEQDIHKWAARQNIRLNLGNGSEPIPSDSQHPSLARAFANGGTCHNIKGEDKASVVGNCIERMTAVPKDFKQDLLDRILQREAAMSTGIGSSVAIPHSREPLPYLGSSMVVTCFLQSPVAYDALDAKPVNTLFFLLSASLSHHLPLLSSLSRCIKDGQFLAVLHDQPSAERLVATIESFGL